MDEVQAELRRRLADSAGDVRALTHAHASGRQAGVGFRSALREAVQRREAAEHELERHVRRTSRSRASW